MPINIVDTSIEEAERLFHGVLPPRCIEYIARLADNNRVLQHAVNDLLKHQQTIVEALALQSKANHLVRAKLNAIEKRYADDDGPVTSEEAN